MVNFPESDSNRPHNLQRLHLSPTTAYYTRKLLRQNFDRLQSVVIEGAGMKADSLSDLNAVLESLYLDNETINKTILQLERLVSAHQSIKGLGISNRQEMMNLEQQIFWLLGFKPLVPKQKGTILIVDDMPKNLHLLSSTLSQQGYDIRTAVNGMMALKAIRQIMPDLVLLDVMMPGINGYEVCEQLKASHLTQDIPVIFISAVDDPLDKVKAFKVGGVDYITKPFQVDEVLARVEHQLNLRSLQKRLEEQNVRLQQEIRERRRAEEEALRALEREKEFSEMKSRFMSMVSHEFRTPLTVIQSSIELLKHYGVSNTKSTQWFQPIDTAIKHMLQLMDDILLLNQANSDHLKPNPTEFELHQFCTELLADMGLVADDRHSFQFVHNTNSKTVYLDQKLLRQILYNLLSNAIKYSPQGGMITLTLLEQDTRLILQIQDEGIGIPLQDQMHLFEAFHRAINTNEIPGTGLGLAIVKKCVELQNGTITVESKIGMGTTFTIELPIVLDN